MTLKKVEKPPLIFLYQSDWQNGIDRQRRIGGQRALEGVKGRR